MTSKIFWCKQGNPGKQIIPKAAKWSYKISIIFILRILSPPLQSTVRKLLLKKKNGLCIIRKIKTEWKIETVEATTPIRTTLIAHQFQRTMTSVWIYTSSPVSWHQTVSTIFVHKTTVFLSTYCYASLSAVGALLTGFECSTVKNSGLIRNFTGGDWSNKVSLDLEVEWGSTFSLRKSKSKAKDKRLPVIIIIPKELHWLESHKQEKH